MSLAGHTDATVQSPNGCVSICLVSSLLVLASLTWLRDCHSPSRAEVSLTGFQSVSAQILKLHLDLKKSGFGLHIRFFYVHYKKRKRNQISK